MEKCFLTNGGSLLRLHPSEKYYFQKPSGEFIREISTNEAEFLCENCLEIEVHNAPEHPEFLPTWHFVTSVLVEDDYSNYRSGLSCNGGAYSFHTYHLWYAAKYPDGKWKFAFVNQHTTSAEFEYDELYGGFQQNLKWMTLTNVAPYEVDVENFRTFLWEDAEEVLEKIGTISTFENMWKETYEYIPSQWDEEDEGFERTLSFSDKKRIITRLKELGVPKFSSYKRSYRRGGGKRR